VFVIVYQTSEISKLWHSAHCHKNHNYLATRLVTAVHISAVSKSESVANIRFGLVDMAHCERPVRQTAVTHVLVCFNAPTLHCNFNLSTRLWISFH
jgi:hypothetical protein